jgi:tripartite-type tricarboxylate transporter receptor subunit TctC
MKTIRPLAAIGFAFLASFLVASASAQYPARQIKVVIPFPPGTPPDAIGRITIQKMGEGMAHTFLIENRPGQAGTIGTEAVAKSPPDGYTVLLGTTGAIASAPNLYPNVGFDPLRSFAPITRLSESVYLVFVHSSVPASSLQELIDLAKAKPGALAFGSFGNGNPLHIAGEMFKQATGAELLHVPYNKGDPSLDFAAGRTQVMFWQLPQLVGHLRAGKIRALAVAGANRLHQVPDVPTSAEAGLPGYEVSVWTGFLAPAGTPNEIVARLNAEARKALASKDILETFAKSGIEPAGTSPEDFARLIHADVAKWSRAIRVSGAKLD